MHRLIIFALVSICCSLFAHGSFAQGNLQFNQVLNYQSNTSEPCGGPGDNFNYTVPTGKVWKIESLNLLRSNTAYGVWQVAMNGIVIWNTVDSANDRILRIETPIWLQENTSFNIGFGNSATGGACPQTVTGSFGVSIIEFNVVP